MPPDWACPAHTDSGQANGNTINITLAAIVRNQHFNNRFLGAIGGLRARKNSSEILSGKGSTKTAMDEVKIIFGT